MACEGASPTLDDVLDTVILGDSRDVLRTLPDACVDAVVTDPPAGIAFMGKDWDDFGGGSGRDGQSERAAYRALHPHCPGYAHSHGRPPSRRGRTAFIESMTGIFTQCRRVLKPGHHALVWALPRTSHWTATALEDSGFYVVDIVTHLQSQGFPKSRSLLKPASEHWILCRAPGPLQPLQIDATRVPLGGTSPDGDGRDGEASAERRYTHRGGTNFAPLPGSRGGAPAGRWPTNAIFSHVGGPDGCRPAGVRRVRVAYSQPTQGERGPGPYIYGDGKGYVSSVGQPCGYADAEGFEQVDAWSCHPQCPIRLLDAQAGRRTSGLMKAGTRRRNRGGYSGPLPAATGQDTYGDTGRCSRFFPTFAPDPEDAVPWLYVPKASRRERNAGLRADQFESVGDAHGGVGADHNSHPT